MIATKERAAGGALRGARDKRFLLDTYVCWMVDEVRPCLGRRLLEGECGWGNVVRLLDAGAEEIVAIDQDQEIKIWCKSD